MGVCIYFAYFNVIFFWVQEPVPQKKQLAIAKNGSVPAKKAKQASSSDSSESSSEEDSSSDEVSIVLMLITFAWLHMFLCMIVNSNFSPGSSHSE